MMPWFQKWPNIFRNVRNTGSRAHVLSHICCCPFERPHDTFLNHQLWVVVFYALNLMVSLFEWYLCFARSNIATKSIDFWGTQVQTQHQGGDQLPHIWPGWSGAWCSWGWSRENPTSSWSLWLCRWSGLPWWTPHSPSWKGYLLVILLRLSTAWWAYPFVWRGTTGGTCISNCAISHVRSSTSWHSLGLARFPSSTWR